jgi:RNA polymerase sigma factor (TIGR02999 family)
LPDHGDITELLHRWRAGSPDAERELFERVVPELRRIAHYLLRGERKGHTLQATEMVDEIYFRLSRAKNQDWRSRQHFFAIAARAMRRYLIDYARARQTGELVTLDGLENLLPMDDEKLDQAIAVDRLLEGLEAVNPQWCTLVELKYFLGFTDEEAADALALKLRTTQRMWLEARQWLFTRMESASDAKRAGR